MVHSDVIVLLGPGGKALWSGQFSFEEECENASEAGRETKPKVC